MLQETAADRVNQTMDTVASGLSHLLADLTGISAESELVSKVLLSSFFILGLLVLRRLFLRFVVGRLADPRARYWWSKTSAYTAFALGVVVVLQIWFEALRSFGTFLGLLSAGLAIALKDPVANLGGWLFILWRRPFDVGDRIQVGPHAGDVIDLALFQFTILEVGNWVDAEQSTGRIIHVPNQKVFTEPLANYTAQFEYIWNEVAVQVTFESNWREAKAILARVADREVAQFTDEAERSMQEAAKKFLIHYRKITPIVYTSVKASGVVLTLRYLCKARHRRGTAQGIWEGVLEEFALRPDIDFAYPTTRFYSNVEEGKPGARAPLPDAEALAAEDVDGRAAAEAHLRRGPSGAPEPPRLAGPGPEPPLPS